eukprot:GHVN01072586.1.p2 GENE.GHVN01072586.1~~GHVN01072586.1.p2  ORF type:complete len:416 (+),score=71.48 GHVN01072586.1:1545-2792(+)
MPTEKRPLADSEVQPSKRLHQQTVAYFCMEYGISERLSLYAGGLGILAGDMVKAAEDKNLPLIAIGILWGEGYNHQTLDKVTGKQLDKFKPVPRGDLVAVDIAKDSLYVTLAGEKVFLQAFKIKGIEILYLLEPVDAKHREITARLYQGDRVAQEIILGVGGVRLLRQLGLPCEVYHLNEGHAVFACFELMREWREMTAKTAETKPTIDDAIAQAKRQTVFTTHTPVKAGNEVHPLTSLQDVVELGFTEEELIQIGSVEGEKGFGMTVAGLRLSCITNGVSELHTNVAREMWKGVSNASSIVSVTNGVHNDTWQDAAVKAAYEKEKMGSTGFLFESHQKCKKALIEEVKKRSDVQLKEDSLLIGFARRVVEYKRALLIFEHDEEIASHLTNGKNQLVSVARPIPMMKKGKRSSLN